MPLITFPRDRRKEDVAAAYRADFPREEGVILVGRWPLNWLDHIYGESNHGEEKDS